MRINVYQKKATRTDQYKGAKNLNAYISPLGLIGEIGSLASVYKKYLRDKNAYKSFHEDAIEELGDTLWYVASIASAHNVTLNAPANLKKVNKNFKNSDQFTITSLEHIDELLNLASKLFHERKLNPNHKPKDVQAELNEALRLLSLMCNLIGAKLSTIMDANLDKTIKRWGPEQERNAHPRASFFDKKFTPQERLPRKIKIIFTETKRGKKTVVHMTVNGMNVGDPITDNAYEPDGYRFHDTFHWSYVAVLGWSPVARSLLKVKRKSDPAKDEVEDGARAQIIEEAITFQIFNYARQNNFLEGKKRVNHDLLKLIKGLSQHLEVKDCAQWEWEKAILDGYKAFRALKKYRKGCLVIDADKRKITFKKS